MVRAQKACCNHYCHCDDHGAAAACCVQGVRAPGEADDAPLDIEDVIQVRHSHILFVCSLSCTLCCSVSCKMEQTHVWSCNLSCSLCWQVAQSCTWTV